MAKKFPAQNFLNRELGLLEFNRRVLAQAEDPSVPLLERLKYLCIVSSNLDEFFEIRVAGLNEQAKLGGLAAGPDGLEAAQILKRLHAPTHQLIARQYQLFNEELVPALAQQGIKFLRRTQWTENQQAWVKDFFLREVMPVLTPIGLDPAHPFPRVLNKSLNFAVELQGKDAFGRNSAAAGSFRLPIWFCVPLFHPACPCRRTVLGHGNAGLLPVPRDPQQRSVRGRGRSKKSAHQSARRAAAATFRRCGASGGCRQLPARIG